MQDVRIGDFKPLLGDWLQPMNLIRVFTFHSCSMKYTINQFRMEFSNDDICLDAILKIRYAKVPCCPQCSQETTFKRVKGRRSYQCSDKDCQYQLYPTAGTVFEKTRTPLKDWFYVIYLMVSTRNGVASKEVERQLGVTYKCALRMTHQIRKLMAQSNELLKGIVEADETYIGGNTKNKHKKQREILNAKGTGAINKTPILGLLERNGRIITKVLEKAEGLVIKPIIKDNVEVGATIITDGFGGYNGLKIDYIHEIVNHEQGEYAKGRSHTNTIEGFWSHLKRMIRGTHITVSVKHMQKYVDESTFRYVHRNEGQEMFFTILDRIAA